MKHKHIKVDEETHHKIKVVAANEKMTMSLFIKELMGIYECSGDLKELRKRTFNKRQELLNTG